MSWSNLAVAIVHGAKDLAKERSRRSSEEWTVFLVETNLCCD